VTVAWAVTVTRGVDAAWAERVGVADGEAGADVCDVLEAEALAEADLAVDGLLAAALLADRLLEAALLADRLLEAELLVAGCVVAAEDPPPATDGVRDAECVAEPDDDVSGVGTKVDGTEEPPPMQAETVTVSRTAPAARRPAASQASRVAAGVLSRIFMDPPRTRVRYTR
jgi:hypothetical protein